MKLPFQKKKITIIQNQSEISNKMETEEPLYEQYCSDLILDFSIFLDQHINSDCLLKLLDGKQTKLYCHKIILANASQFFHNVFTSGMEEEKTAEVEIKCNPLNQFPHVLRFIYTSSIDINDDNVMAIFEIAHFYEIQILEEFIKQNLSTVDPSKIMIYTKSCYDNELTEALKILIPYMAQYYDRIQLSEFSLNLDIKIFCNVLSLAIENGTFKGDINKELDEFLNGTSPNQEEKAEIDKLINYYRSFVH